MKNFPSTKLDARQWEGGGSSSMISHLFSPQTSLLWPILSNILARKRSALFNLILLLLSNIFSLIRSTQIFSVWSDLIQYNSIQPDIIFSIIFDPLNFICSDYLYSAHSNQIQSDCSLFPDKLFTLCSSELLTFIKITYHYYQSKLVITCTKGYKL